MLAKVLSDNAFDVWIKNLSAICDTKSGAVDADP